MSENDPRFTGMTRETHPERFGAGLTAGGEEPEEEHVKECPGCEELRNEKAAIEQELEARRAAVSNLSSAVQNMQNALYISQQEVRAWRKLADAQDAIVELKGGEEAAGP